MTVKYPANKVGEPNVHVFFYKEHLYKELEVEKGSKNKEFLRNNWPGWNKSSNLRNTKEH